MAQCVMAQCVIGQFVMRECVIGQFAMRECAIGQCAMRECAEGRRSEGRSGHRTVLHVDGGIGKSLRHITGRVGTAPARPSSSPPELPEDPMLTRRFYLMMAVVAATSGLAACQRETAARLDDALRNDLSLASQAQPYLPQSYVSPEEQVGAPVGYYPAPRYAPQPYYAPRPVYPTRAPRVVYRRTPPPRVIQRAPSAEPEPEYGNGGSVFGNDQRVIKNTKRDAVIGAAAGAAIGVASTRNTLKGAIIGAAAGGLLGAIVGEKIDVRRPR